MPKSADPQALVEQWSVALGWLTMGGANPLQRPDRLGPGYSPSQIAQYREGYAKHTAKRAHYYRELLRLSDGLVPAVEAAGLDATPLIRLARELLNGADAATPQTIDAAGETMTRFAARLVIADPPQEGQRGDEWTLAHAARELGIPKSAWSKAANKPPDDVGHLPTRKVGRGRFVTVANARTFAITYDAKREQRAVGTKSSLSAVSIAHALRGCGKKVSARK